MTLLKRRSNRTYDVTVILAAGANRQFSIPGEYVRVRSVSTAGAAVRIKSSEQDDFSLYVNQGVRFMQDGAPHTPEVVTVQNDTVGALTIGLLFGDGYFDAQEISGTVAVSGVVEVHDQSQPAFSSVADVSCAAGATTSVISASTGNKRRVYVGNPAYSGVVLRGGDTGAAAAEGIPIYPGDVVPFDRDGSLSIYNPGAGAVLVSISTVEWPL